MQVTMSILAILETHTRLLTHETSIKTKITTQSSRASSIGRGDQIGASILISKHSQLPSRVSSRV